MRRFAPKTFGPVLGVLLIAVLAAGCVLLVLALNAKSRSEAVGVASQASHYTPPPLVTELAPLVTVIGDQLTAAPVTSAAPTSSTAATNTWPALAATALKARVEPFALSGSGYLVTGPKITFGGSTFGTRAQNISTSARVVVFFGGANDAGVTPSKLRAAAALAFSTARTNAPDARIVVVGPVSTTADPSADLLAVRDTLRSAAAAASATFVDPIDEGWLQSSTGLVRSNGMPTAKGARTLSAHFVKILKPLLASTN